MARKKNKSLRYLPWILIFLVFSAGAFLVGRNWWLERQAGMIRYQEFGIDIPDEQRKMKVTLLDLVAVVESNLNK